MKTLIKTTRVAVLFFAAGVCVGWVGWAHGVDAADAARPTSPSRVVSLRETPKNKAACGEMRPYFTGQTSGTDRVLAASGTLLPGKSVHGAHRHLAEEYLLITECSGNWHLDGKEFP